MALKLLHSYREHYLFLALLAYCKLYLDINFLFKNPAGLWWGIFSLYASLGVVLFGSSNETLKVLQYAFLLSGIICIILSVFGLIDKLVRYFTPTVIGTYLFLLVAQLSGAFLKGMFGLDGQHTEVQADVFILSLIVILLSFSL